MIDELMDGKIVLVVGCNFKDNIGAATVEKFQKAGAIVLTMDLVDEGADYLHSASDIHMVNNSFMDIKKRYKRLDTIVCCHGVNLMGSLEEYDMHKWYQTMDANVTSLFVLLQAYTKIFDNQGYKKSFVVVTSDTAEIPKTATFAYGASKAAANHFIRCAARELNKYHVDDWCVTGLAIGMVEGTPMDKKTISDLMEQRGITHKEARNMLVNNIPVKRGATTEEVAEWLYFLATKGRYASGNILRVDSGQCQG